MRPRSIFVKQPPSPAQRKLLNIHHVSNFAITVLDYSWQEWADLLDDLQAGTRKACPFDDPIIGKPCRMPFYVSAGSKCESCALIERLNS